MHVSPRAGSPRMLGTDFYQCDPYPTTPTTPTTPTNNPTESPRGRYMRQNTPPLTFMLPEMLPDAPADFEFHASPELQFVEENPSIRFLTRTGYCHWCGTTSSPEWRPGPHGKKTLCNACGLKFSRNSNSPGGMIEEYPS